MQTKKSPRTSIPFGRLASLYYPSHSYKQASNLFRKELRNTRGLWNALKDVGYTDNQRIVLPKQVQVIKKYLGEPL